MRQVSGCPDICTLQQRTVQSFVSSLDAQFLPHVLWTACCTVGFVAKCHAHDLTSAPSLLLAWLTAFLLMHRRHRSGLGTA